MFKRAGLGILLAVTLGFLAGCATLNESECKTAHWRQIGLSDGKRGYPSTRLADHAEACQEHGITPDSHLWHSGWTEGLNDYCTPNNGWRVGTRGESYQGVCTGPSEEAFLRTYTIGRKLYEVESEIRRIDSEINGLESRILKLKDGKDRQTLRLDIRRLDLQRSMLRLERIGLEAKRLVD